MSTTRKTTAARKTRRCAIYTRKSTEEGLDREFNSLDAQREAAEAYIKSQAHEGWVRLPEHYDDGGFTGGNMDRPALARLIADIEAGRIDAVIVYKVDRFSRSLLDFAKMMELFERHQVAFVSVTQQFNTATSMGRLILNVLLSFAQFEREIISERTRDKIAAARRKGKWSGGMPRLGYDVDPRLKKLIVNEEEAARVRAIFQLYLEHQALRPVVQECDASCVEDLADLVGIAVTVRPAPEQKDQHPRGDDAERPHDGDPRTAGRAECPAQRRLSSGHPRPA